MILLQASNYALPAVIGIAALISACTAVAAFFVARTVYKTTLPTRLAETLKANFEAEKVRADQATTEVNRLREEKRVWDAEKASISTEYSQLSQLYARKSIILEKLTGIYGNLAHVAEAGTVEEFLAALAHPVKRDLDQGGEIHKTKG